MHHYSRICRYYTFHIENYLKLVLGKWQSSTTSVFPGKCTLYLLEMVTSSFLEISVCIFTHITQKTSWKHKTHNFLSHSHPYMYKLCHNNQNHYSIKSAPAPPLNFSPSGLSRASNQLEYLLFKWIEMLMFVHYSIMITRLNRKNEWVNPASQARHVSIFYHL